MRRSVVRCTLFAVLSVAMLACVGTGSPVPDSGAGEGSTEHAVIGSALTDPATIMVPVVPVTNDAPRAALYAQVTGIGSGAHPLYVPLALPVGTAIQAIRARVRDAGANGRLQLGIMSTNDGAQNFKWIALSPSSTGSGAEETLTILTPAITGPVTQYYVTLFHNAAVSNVSAVSAVYRLELDIAKDNPPPRAAPVIN